MDIFIITLKLALGFIIILLIMRLLGKRNLAQLNAGDVIYLLVFGGILEESIYDDQVKFWHVMIALIVWGALFTFSNTYYIVQK